LVLLIISVADTMATVYTAQINGDWNNPATWSPAGIPGAGDDVNTNNRHVILTSDVTIHNISLVGGSIDLSNYRLTVTGKVTNRGVFKGGSNAKMSFTGSEDVGTITFDHSFRTLSVFEFDRIGYLVTLNNDLKVEDSLILKGGKVNLGTHILTLGLSISDPGFLDVSNGGYIEGKFERWISNTTGSYIFPLSVGITSRKVTVDYSSAPVGGRIIVTAFDSDPGKTNTGNIMDGSYVIDRYSKSAWWTITNPGGGLAGYNYSINLEAGLIPGVSNVNLYQLRVIKRPNSSTDWSVEGTHINATGSTFFPIVKRGGLTTFSDFGIGGNSADGNTLGDDPLPVTLKSFTSSVNGRNVRLNWVTEKEYNNKGFEVQRKGNNAQNSGWQNLGFIDSKAGSNSALNYTFEDKNLNSGKFNYRLKQIDYNGNFEYFELTGDVVVGVPGKFNLSQNYPNPFNPVTKINFDLPEDGKVTLKIYDMLGREAAVLVNEARTAGYHTVEFNAGNLSSGMYFYRLVSGNYSAVKKMVVLK
ncbi:MAG: T9SS type A sorting domain-containing protein, partial [Ignavibacteria bacterium]|nr:T9SS type A sorting domain-containing protein [Ignavibacteria bacterium]